MTETLTKPPELQTETAPPMLHWLDPLREGYALCGHKITKVIGGITHAECVVCEQMKFGS